MGWWSWVLVVGIVALLLDRALLALERRRWIVWRTRAPSGTRAGGAMLAVHALFEPDRRHVLEERAREAAHIELAGDDDPLEPGPR